VASPFPGKPAVAHAGCRPPADPANEASTNLLDWEEVANDINAEDGVSVVDDEKREFPHRFFRVVPEYGDRDDE